MRPTPISRRRGEKRNRRPHRGSTVSASKPSKTAQPHTGPRVSAPCLRPDERVNSRARIRTRGNVARRTKGVQKIRCRGACVGHPLETRRRERVETAGVEH